MRTEITSKVPGYPQPEISVLSIGMLRHAQLKFKAIFFSESILPILKYFELG
jgi:hypothetical protein